MYRLHVITATYKWTLISMCTLQASCRHAAGQAKIPPLVWNHNSPIEKCTIFFFNVEIFFLVIASVKTRHILKRAWQGLSDNDKRKARKKYTWHLTRDTWHVTGGGRWTYSQNVRSLALMVWIKGGLKIRRKRMTDRLNWWQRCL